MDLAVAAIAGVVIGGLVGWLIAGARSHGRIADLSARLDESQRRADKVETAAKSDFESLRERLGHESQIRVAAERDRDNALARVAEERRLLDESREKLKDTFQALAGSSLKSTSEQFLELAKTKFDEILSDAKGDLTQRQEAIKGLVSPLSEKLDKFDSHVRQLEEKREGAYSKLGEQIRFLAENHEKLQRETGNLVTALRTPQVRGRWGEVQLKRVVELAGLSEHCDFTEQSSHDTESGRIRPDLVVHLPENRELVIDAKFPLDAYYSAVSAESEQDRSTYLEMHARKVRAHMKALSNKDYLSQFQTAPQFVVMFLPGESFFSAALDKDRTLIEDGIAQNVILATPTTLIALLRAVAYGWRQEQVAQNAREISDLGRELYNRMRLLAGHVVKIGDGLAKANDSYNKAVGSLEARVLPAARKFQELGAAPGDEIPLLNPLEQAPRMLNAPELTPEEDEPRTTPFPARRNEG